MVPDSAGSFERKHGVIVIYGYYLFHNIFACQVYTALLVSLNIASILVVSSRYDEKFNQVY
jgi:hypothetical protein